MCAVLPLEGENLYVRLKCSSQIKRRALIDTGSCANALPESLFNDINLTNRKSLTLEKHLFNSVRMASGRRVPVDKQAKISFQIGPHYFQDSFLILPTMSSVILGNPFFKKHNITIDPKNNLLQLPDLTVQLNQILPEKGKKTLLHEEITENSFDLDQESTNSASVTSTFRMQFGEIIRSVPILYRISYS